MSQNYRGVKRSAECLEKKEKFNVIRIYEAVFVASNNTSLSGVGSMGEGMSTDVDRNLC